MTTEERRALLDRAITTYGAPAQMDMAVEEMAELTKALCKIKRAQAGCEVTAAIGNVIEEMADVQIMLDQLRIIFHRSTEEVEEAKLERLNDQSRKDDLVTFEELGVDRVFVDESHYFKNLFLATKMRNVGGIAQTEAQKSLSLIHI